MACTVWCCVLLILPFYMFNAPQVIGSPVENASPGSNANMVVNRAHQLKQKVQLKKEKLQWANDRNMHIWWSEFKNKMEHFRSIKEELVCKDKPSLLMLLDELKEKIGKV